MVYCWIFPDKIPYIQHYIDNEEEIVADPFLDLFYITFSMQAKLYSLDSCKMIKFSKTAISSQKRLIWKNEHDLSLIHTQLLRWMKSTYASFYPWAPAPILKGSRSFMELTFQRLITCSLFSRERSSWKRVSNEISFTFERSL